MELRQLRHFVAVVEAGNLSVAATRVHLSQPALSRSISKLEAELGARLLERKARGVVPTSAGRVFVAEARFILNECQRARDEVVATAHGDEQRVAVGVVPMFVSSIATGALAALQDKAPNLELLVDEGGIAGLVDRLAAGELDVALTTFTQSSPPKSLIQERLFVVTAVVAAGANNPISRQRRPSAADFSKAKWVTIGQGWDSSVVDQYLMSNGFPPPVRPLHTNSLVLTKTLIAEEGYVSMLPYHMLSREIERGEIVALPLPSGGFRRAAGLMYRSRAEQRQGVALTIEALRAACRAFSSRQGKGQR